VISRPSFKDVVGIDIATGQVRWRFEVAGQRSDHMAISPNGRHVAVSASTGNVVHVLDTATGVEVGRWASGDSPHENTYTKDGKRIIHASIGLVYTPADQPQVDTSKGKRVFQEVDARTFKVLSEVNMGQKLKEAGYPNMSAAVRPMAIAPKERIVFLQVSFFHGFVVYDLKQQKVLKVVTCRSPRRRRASRGRTTCSTRPTTGSRSAATARSFVSPGRCPTTRRSCGGAASRTRSSTTARSRTGPPPAPTAGSATSPGAAPTRSRSTPSRR
jgi:hypothetical protein